jgi:2-dehydropantoate 2-reductase
MQAIKPVLLRHSRLGSRIHPFPVTLTANRHATYDAGGQTSLSNDQSHKRIFILGTGNVGNFVAHALAGLPERPPITLLLHSRKSIDAWKRRQGVIELVTDGISEVRDGFDAELCASTDGSDSRLERQNEAIHNLIVAVKAPNTVAALNTVKDRLNHQTQILFIQNGMGVPEEVSAKVFPIKEQRPGYSLGITSHGINSTVPFTITHAGRGSTSLATLPPDTPEAPPPGPTGPPTSSNYLLRTLTQSPQLQAREHPYADFLQLQAEKLAINATINPLSAMLNCRNGQLLQNAHTTSLAHLLIAEISQLIRSLDELQGVADVQTRFAPPRLEALVASVARRTRDNISSMLQDIRAGRPTEIEYINGYVVRRARDMGLQCPHNDTLLQLVLARQMQQQEIKAAAL